MDNRRPLVPSNGGQGKQYFPSLPLQEESSLYNITFDEEHDQLGNELGKPLNVDDELIIRNVISVEESDQYQPVQNPAPSSSSSSNNPPSFLGNFNLNGASSKKTIDEAWKEIANQAHVNDLDNQLIGQQLGETTLEDFLAIRAGVINKGNQNRVFNHQPIMEVDPAQQTDLLQFQIQQQQQQQEQMTTTALEMEYSNNFQMSAESVNNYEKGAVGYSDNQLVLPVTLPLSATTSDSQLAAAQKKCRYTDDQMMKKAIERRQKRMIKNRESAARSRARKQAYTNQLEHVVLHSRNTNCCLKKQKELEILLSSSDLTPMPRFQLRRTSSASF